MSSFCEQHSNSSGTGCGWQATRSVPLPHRYTEGLLRFEEHGLSLAKQNVGIGVTVLIGEVRRMRPLHLILLLIPSGVAFRYCVELLKRLGSLGSLFCHPPTCP